ncbi:hypothetical protein GUITHDRAFT_132591 [Guillardia theta CCMP2712]|uniref:Uncharacterized protein n=1 Tax=Guillardia theta (strain CCMP2712) TaxID=905079 RepID=L1K1E5_GUITC|nr:hypothetical protein GUITHDRAFT_132591 [Guillardia theta CCMP2712]EKX54198.1 hypothetical protein GUITHDRAFT_132591 [Guillardia theta CCMP2712]|eukprot:XP_005841178.1 hypothetical protein GUITHDRAFT_132591 [Guillardia theta CCMP2712]
MAGVVATLKLQFAKTMSLAVSISDNIRKPAVSILAPFLIYSLPPEHHPWINPILDLTCKFLAMSLAWYLSRIISAVHSAIIGGLAASRACIQLLNDRKLITLDIDKLRILATFADVITKSMIDEYSGWTLAAMGILFQLGQGMQLSFPLNILLLPLSFVEVSLQWAVTFMK